MKPSFLRCAGLAMVLGVACAAPLRPNPIGPGHPADPGSSATAFAPAPNPFEVTPTFDLPGGAQPSARVRATGEDTPDVVYTCPMHPAVRSAAPGECPECGMTLRPVPQEAHPHGHEHGGGPR